MGARCLQQRPVPVLRRRDHLEKHDGQEGKFRPLHSRSSMRLKSTSPAELRLHFSLGEGEPAGSGVAEATPCIKSTDSGDGVPFQ